MRRPRNAEEFLAGLWLGRGRVRGRSGGYTAVTREALRISRAVMANQRWCRLLLPVLAAVPLVTLANFTAERLFAHR